jgi:hypothetical protein
LQLKPLLSIAISTETEINNPPLANQIWTLFEQNFENKNRKDRGIKTMVWSRTGKRFKVLAEVWKPLVKAGLELPLAQNIPQPSRLESNKKNRPKLKVAARKQARPQTLAQKQTSTKHCAKSSQSTCEYRARSHHRAPKPH